MSKMLKIAALAFTVAAGFAAAAVDSSFAAISKYVPRSADVVMYTDSVAFRGNKLLTAGLDKIPDLDFAAGAGLAAKVCEIYDSAVLCGSTGDSLDGMTLLFSSSKCADLDSLEAALKGVLDADVSAGFTISEIGGRKALKVSDEFVVVALEPGFFMLCGPEYVASNLNAEKGIGEPLASRIKPYAGSKMFMVFGIPVDEDVPPVAEYVALTVDPVGNDGAKLFLTIVLGEGMHIDTVCKFNAAMVDKTVSAIVEWYKNMIGGANGGPGQDNAGTDGGEMEINEVSE